MPPFFGRGRNRGALHVPGGVVGTTGNRRGPDWLSRDRRNDDGVGIAARQAQDVDSSAGEIEEELAAFGKALESGSSIKLTTNDAPVRGNPGYGYTHITGALRSLKAFASLRTGRIAASFDGLAASDAAEPREAAFDVSSVAQWSGPGTALEVFVPVVHSQPSLFG